MSKYFPCAILAPSNNLSMFIPAVAIGNNPTAVNTEYLPPILSGITNVVYPSSSAICFRAPLSLSVVTYILFLASSSPYLFSNNSLKILKATAGSVVVLILILHLLTSPCFLLILLNHLSN